MRKLFVTPGLLLLAGLPTWAGPCVPGNLQDYVNLGAGGCTIGAVLFNDFMSQAPGIGTPIPLTTIAVTPSGGTFAPRLDFDVFQDIGPGAALAAQFTYKASGVPFTGASLFLKDPNVTPDGVVTGVEDLCLGGMFSPGGPTGCTGTTAAPLVTVDAGILPMLTDSRTFAPVTSLNVVKNLTIDGGLNGSASAAGIANSFAAIPEPSTYGLVLLGGLGLMWYRRRATARRLIFESEEL